MEAPLQSRFFIVELEPYTYEEFYEIAVHLLDRDFARNIADVVWNTSRNLRDCVRIGKLAKSEQDVNFLAEKFLRHDLRELEYTVQKNKKMMDFR